jgi:iron-sulfur cluster repair protein YtfE (RIC family)
MPLTNEIDPRLPVNEVIRLQPAAVAVFNRLGVDACCGGAQPVGEAAAELGIAWEEMAAALSAAEEAA